MSGLEINVLEIVEEIPERDKPQPIKKAGIGVFTIIGFVPIQ